MYAIGDVHGRLDLIKQAHKAIDLDLAERPVANTIEILIGDIVDRGAASCGVIDAIAARRSEIDHDVLCLKGNHEDMFLAFLDDAEVFEAWREVGGYETLLSYGLQRQPITSRADRVDLRDRFMELFPPEHGTFLDALPNYWIENDYLFVHAGLKPGIPIELQDPNDLLWIRDEFLESAADHGRHVIHGHTPVQDIDHRSNRTNIDIGAYATGVLACLVLESDTVEALKITAFGTTRRSVDCV